MNDLKLASSHKPEYRPHTLGRFVVHGQEVPHVEYTLTCKCGFADATLRPKKQQRAIYKAHLLATVGKI